MVLFVLLSCVCVLWSHFTTMTKCFCLKEVFVLFCQQSRHAVASNKQTNKENALISFVFVVPFDSEPLEPATNNTSLTNYTTQESKTITKLTHTWLTPSLNIVNAYFTAWRRWRHRTMFEFTSLLCGYFVLSLDRIYLVFVFFLLSICTWKISVWKKYF